MKKQAGLMMVFLFVSSADAQSSAVIKLDFPPMAVQRVRLGLLLAEEEPFTGTITLDTGTVLTVTRACIPATYVRGLGLRKMVDRCLATGTIDGGGTIVMRLPPEPVRVGLRATTAVAIDAETVIVLANGISMTGSVLFPDCPVWRVGRGTFVAAATATGTARSNKQRTGSRNFQ